MRAVNVQHGELNVADLRLTRRPNGPLLPTDPVVDQSVGLADGGPQTTGVGEGSSDT